MSVPDLNNLTIPGGIILHFGDDPLTLIDLGHINPDNMRMRTSSEELIYESQRSGKLRDAKVFPLKESIEFDFLLDEPVLDNLQIYFKGGEASIDPVTGNPVFSLAMTGFYEGAARLDFLPSTGLQGKFHFPRCQLKPNGDIEFNPRQTMKLPMTLKVLDDYDNNPTYPYGYWEALSEELGS